LLLRSRNLEVRPAIQLHSAVVLRSGSALICLAGMFYFVTALRM
jgi:hypothetical protein